MNYYFLFTFGIDILIYIAAFSVAHNCLLVLIQGDHEEELSSMAVAKAAKHFSNLYALTFIEWRGDMEEKMEAAYNTHILKVSNLAEQERHDSLIGLISQGLCNDIALGLLYGILTNAETAPENFRDLTFITGDGLQFAMAKVNWIVAEMFQKLLEFPRNQVNFKIKWRRVE
ncbi:unnamed protein product [Soboliphyme baturini]|uniref:SOSS complex subunit A homolog n=1 Tax=Soboliphyme baturini TaxID=241478 RepID=A0A183J2H0_9BILA|nr:unnamed protein product [Soboliphyme baturini]